jgi:hypothetical protein
MGRLHSRHRSVVLNRCVAVSARSAWAVRPSAAGAPFAVFARGSVSALARAVCPSAASARSASAPSASLALSCPPRSFRVQQSAQRPRAKVVFFRGTRKSSSCAAASKPSPRSVSAVAAMKKVSLCHGNGHLHHALSSRLLSLGFVQFGLPQTSCLLLAT